MEALQRSEAKYRRLVDRSYPPLFILDRELTIQFACDSLRDTRLQEPAQVIGKSFFEAFRVPESQALAALLTELACEPLYATRQLEISLAPGGPAPGETQYFDLYATNLLGDEDIGGFVLCLHNVTGRKRAEEELRRINAELDSFVYKASHDMRAPLLNLLGLIDIAQRDYPRGTPQHLDYMKRSVLRLDNFIVDLVHYARNERTEVERRPLDLTTLIVGVLEDLRFMAPGAHIRFEVDLQVNRPVYTDAMRLSIILKNLVSNAIKYHDLGKERPLVRVLARDLPGQRAFAIEVADNGTGIPENSQDKVFDMFYRATNQSEGSGLGLYIVKKAVEKLGGRIELRTRYREGSSFTVTLPDAGP
jgi:signal transduction histidine kinase